MKKIIYTLFAMLGFANFTMAQLPSYVPTDSLKGWWGFNGNANDLSGNGKNGTASNATLTTDRYTASNSSYSFNGSTSYIGVPLINASGGNKLTISVWVNPLDISSNLNYHIMRQDNGTSSLDWLLAFQNYGTILSFGLYPSGVYSELDIPISASNYTNSWHNITAVYNGTSRSIYRDGILIGSDSINGNVSYTSNATFAFGASAANSGASEKFNGKIDDVGIWKRALSAQEILNLYLANNCPDTITTQPTNQIGNKGSNKTISFAHSGTGNSYQWQSNAAVLGWQNVPNVTSYSGATSNSLTVNNLSVSNHNQLFRVVTSKTGCKDTSNAVSLTLANIATDSLRLLRLQADSSRLTNESIVYLARINKLMNDSAYYTSRIFKLSNDSVFYVNRIAKLINDSVYYNGRITKLISDSNVFVSRINKLSNDSDYFVSRITKLTNDSVYYTGRITKLINDSNAFVVRINKLSYDSVINLGRITNLKTDSINNKTTISLLNADIVTKGNIITFLQLDTTNKGITIRQLQIDLANKHDTVYIASVITSDTLRIAIRTGILSTSPIINSLKVYPNPASTLLYIDLEKPGYFIAKLSSITGQSIITPTSGTIDVSSLANGVYILTIYDSNNKLISTNKVAIIK
jgi:hypothetical protein